MPGSGNHIKVISRNSPLALLQVEELFTQFPEIPYDLISIESFGDVNKQISLLDSPPADIFTRELDNALLNAHADIAVHSAKDLPFPLPFGLSVIALTDAFDQSDVLISINNAKLSDLSKGAKVGTSSPVRKRELLQLRPDLEIVSIRGTIQERIALVESGQIDALIVAGCALARLGLSHRIAEVLKFETHPLQGFLAVVARNDFKRKNLFETVDIRRKYGKVHLIGFGPGNPDYLTLAGLKALESADVIYYDDLTNKEFLLKFKAECVYVGKRSGQHSMEQFQINRLLLESARKGLNVARLKGGDPSIFAHGGEEIDYLHSNFIELEVIPGITTALATAAIHKFSLTHRNVASSVGFVTGHSATVDLPNTETLVVYMGASRMKEIAKLAIAQGRPSSTAVLIAQSVSTQEEKYTHYSLKDLVENEYKLKTPLLMVIGNVVDVHKRNVKTLNTLYTGTSLPKEKLTNIIHQPLIELRKLDSFDLDSFVSNLKSFEWILFTSRYTVNFLFESLYENGLDARLFSGLRIASIGKSTSNALKEKGLLAELEPEIESSEGFLNLVDRLEINPSTILIPRSKKALPVIPNGLGRRNWTVKIVELYDNFLPENIQNENLNQIDKVVFTSPSTVTNFLKVYGCFPSEIKYEFKGNETEKRFYELNSTKN